MPPLEPKGDAKSLNEKKGSKKRGQGSTLDIVYLIYLLIFELIDNTGFQEYRDV